MCLTSPSSYIVTGSKAFSMKVAWGGMGTGHDSLGASGVFSHNTQAAKGAFTLEQLWIRLWCYKLPCLGYISNNIDGKHQKKVLFYCMQLLSVNG